MKHSYLEVTFRKGKPLAAYYYLPRRAEETSVRTQRFDGGFVVDYASDGCAIGIEILSPGQFDIAQWNRVLESLGQEPIPREDLAPLVAA
ncbi:MAG: hypothetical protein WD066_18485 [Planctomycetaceae bacterium]